MEARHLRDPAAVAKRALELVPLLVRLEPELARRIAAELEAAIG